MNSVPPRSSLGWSRSSINIACRPLAMLCLLRRGSLLYQGGAAAQVDESVASLQEQCYMSTEHLLAE